MKTRFDMFRTKYPSFKFQGVYPPVSGPVGSVGPVGGTLDGTPAPSVHDVPGINEPAPPADMDFRQELENAGTKLPPAKSWDVPGGAGSVSNGIPGGSGIEEVGPGHEGGEFFEPVIPHEPAPIFHGEKRKRARRGQGFGPRRG